MFTRHLDLLALKNKQTQVPLSLKMIMHFVLQAQQTLYGLRGHSDARTGVLSQRLATKSRPLGEVPCFLLLCSLWLRVREEKTIPAGNVLDKVAERADSPHRGRSLPTSSIQFSVSLVTGVHLP